MNVSVIVPPASIASTRGSRPFRLSATSNPASRVPYALLAAGRTLESFKGCGPEPILTSRRVPTLRQMKVRLLLPALVALAALACRAPRAASATGRALVLLERPAPGAIASARVQARAVIARHGLRRAGPEVPRWGC